MARKFDGTDDVVEAASAPLLAVPLSMSVLFQADALPGGSAGLVSIVSNVDENGFAITLRSTGAVRARASNDVGFAESATTSATISTGSLNQAGGAWASASSIAAYLNGGNKVTDVDTLALNGTINRTVLGATREGGTLLDFYNGKLQEFGVWNVVLEEWEWALLGRKISPRHIRPQNLIEYVPLIGGGLIESGWKGRQYSVTGALTVPHGPVYSRRAQQPRSRVLHTTASPPASSSGMFFAAG